MLRRLSHPVRSLSNPSAARRPHTHRLRRARWEPLVETKRTAAYPRRPGSDARYKERTPPRYALPKPCIPPACSVFTCHPIHCQDPGL